MKVVGTLYGAKAIAATYANAHPGSGVILFSRELGCPSVMDDHTNGSGVVMYQSSVSAYNLAPEQYDLVVLHLSHQSDFSYLDITQIQSLEYSDDTRAILAVHPVVCENSRDCIVCEKPIEAAAGVCFGDYDKVRGERDSYKNANQACLLDYQELWRLRSEVKTSDISADVLRADLYRSKAQLAAANACISIQNARSAEFQTEISALKYDLAKAEAEIKAIKKRDITIKVDVSPEQIAEIAAEMRKPYADIIFGEQTDYQRLAAVRGAITSKRGMVEFRAKRGVDGVGIDGKTSIAFYHDKNGNVEGVMVYAGRANGWDQE